MRLYYTPTSPFVRKVLVAAHELGLASRIETVALRPSPTRADPVLSAANPLNKIPTLVLDAPADEAAEGVGPGGALYDSHVICDYLGSLVEHPCLVPARGPARYDVLRREALADGVLDAAILVFYERHSRPSELHWSDWLEGQSQKALQGLDALEREVASFAGRVDLGTISAAVALGWLDFRGVLGDLWATRPALASWYRGFAERSSMRATVPHV